MLHNTGPYGPNEAPVNMGAPINMSQIPSSMIPHNLNNLNKIPQPPPQTSTGSYNIPHFPPYGHPPMSMGPQFPNYHSPFQSHFIGQSPNPLLDTGWQNGMLPMNLNVQNEQATQSLNYTNYDKRQNNPMNDFRDLNQYRKTPINIPQVPTKAYHKHTGLNENFNNFGMYSDNFRQSPENLDLSIKTPDLLENENTRRKLENTIKLIENILVNTTKNRELAQNKESKMDDPESSNEPSEPATTNTEDDKEEINEMEMADQDALDDNQSLPDHESEVSEPETKPAIEELKEVNVEIEEVAAVTIKVEQLPWTYSEELQLFQNDKNGILRDNLTEGDGNVIDSELSVSEATDMVKNGKNLIIYY